MADTADICLQNIGSHVTPYAQILKVAIYSKIKRHILFKFLRGIHNLPF